MIRINNPNRNYLLPKHDFFIDSGIATDLISFIYQYKDYNFTTKFKTDIHSYIYQNYSSYILLNSFSDKENFAIIIASWLNLNKHI